MDKKMLAVLLLTLAAVAAIVFGIRGMGSGPAVKSVG